MAKARYRTQKPNFICPLATGPVGGRSTSTLGHESAAGHQRALAPRPRLGGHPPDPRPGLPAAFAGPGSTDCWGLGASPPVVMVVATLSWQG